MRTIFLFFALVSGCFLNAQTFYEKIMEMNTANADTCNDITVLQMSAKAMERVSRGISNNWDATFHVGLCYVRMTDLLLIKKDTLGAKSTFGLAKTNLKIADTLSLNNPENKVLAFYQKINELRMTKTDIKSIKALESQMESFKITNNTNPRIRIVYAYFYKCFYLANKSKRKKALGLLEEANKLFELQTFKEFNPKWGKKWMNEISNELSSKPELLKKK